jgi:hypothetical protein
MAGALVAFIDRGVEFDVISTSGAGALMGLLYATPQGGDPRGGQASLARSRLRKYPDHAIAIVRRSRGGNREVTRT